MPRKESDVSAKIMPGIARVTLAMMWLIKDGTMCFMMMTGSLMPSKAGGGHKIFSFEGEKAAPHHPAQPGPADERQDNGNPEIHAQGRHRQRDGRRQPIHSGMVGIERKNSITRWITLSIQPP